VTHPDFAEPGRDTVADAGLSDGAYLIREAMRRALARAAASLVQAAPGPREFVLLDVGGRGRPYAAIFASALSGAGRSVRHLVIDPGPGADAVARAETLPIVSACADLVLCTQVLEHVEDPPAAVSEMARALKPGGTCLLTTHGTWFYHPDPEDFWRWTPAGLARLFTRCGFGQVTVEPVGGTKLALAVLGLTSLDRATRDTAAGGPVRRLLVAPANWLAARRLLHRATGRVCTPGELAINYLVTARR